MGACGDNVSTWTRATLKQFYFSIVAEEPSTCEMPQVKVSKSF